MHLPIITAHSGCEGTARDSRESLERAIALGADAAEVDVRRALDGTLYISHDRQETAEGKLTLEAVFRTRRQTPLRLNCDIKEPFAVSGVLDLALRFDFGPDRLILTGSVSPELLALERAVTAGAGIWLNIEEALKFPCVARLFAAGEEDRFPALMADAKPFVLGMLAEAETVRSLCRLLKTLGAAGVNLPCAVLTEELRMALREAEIPISVWTVNDPAALDRCLALEVGNITTLAVSTALERRRRYVER